MSTCAQITNLTSDLSAVGGGSNDPVTGGQGLLLSNTPLDECTGVILLSAQDYTDLKNASLISLFNEYFGFDPQLFEYIVGSTIVAYILGHSVGAIVKLMRST